jgi:hypothetical protein
MTVFYFEALAAITISLSVLMAIAYPVIFFPRPPQNGVAT